MKIKTLAAIVIPVGEVLKLSNEQARRRSHAITELKEKGFYTVNQPIQFKAGETFETKNELPKAYRHLVEILDVKKKADDGKDRPALDEALKQLPGSYKDADYVVKQMRAHFGKVFTEEDEKTVRALVPSEK